MPTLSDSVIDGGLDYLSAQTTTLHICNAEPTTYSQATGSASLGSGSCSVTGPSDGSPDGRQATVGAVTGGSVTSTGTATHYALVSGSELLATGDINPTRSVTSGDTFSSPSSTVTFRDPT